MADQSPNPALFDGAATADQTAFDVASIVGQGVRVQLAVTGRQVSGRADLTAPNPKGRRSCTVQYTAPVSWAGDHHAAALRVVLHWFRDIGGFSIVAKRHVCHVVQRLAEGTTEREMHAAVAAYAASEWHRAKKSWATIQRFFTRDLLDKWIDESPELRRERDRANITAADQAIQAQFRAQYARERAERQARKAQAATPATTAAGCHGQAQRRHADADQVNQAATPPAGCHGQAQRRHADQSPERQLRGQPCCSIADAIARLPQRDRWIFPTMISRKADRAAKARARARAEDALVAIWPHLPAAERQRIDAQVQLAVHRRTGELVEVARLTLATRRRLRLAQFLRRLQADRTALPSLDQVLHRDRDVRDLLREARP